MSKNRELDISTVCEEYILVTEAFIDSKDNLHATIQVTLDFEEEPGSGWTDWVKVILEKSK